MNSVLELLYTGQSFVKSQNITDVMSTLHQFGVVDVVCMPKSEIQDNSFSDNKFDVSLQDSEDDGGKDVFDPIESDYESDQGKPVKIQIKEKKRTPKIQKVEEKKYLNLLKKSKRQFHEIDDEDDNENSKRPKRRVCQSYDNEVNDEDNEEDFNHEDEDSSDDKDDDWIEEDLNEKESKYMKKKKEKIKKKLAEDKKAKKKEKPIRMKKYKPKVPLDIRDDKVVRKAIENLDKLKSDKPDLKEETSFFCHLCALKYSNKANLDRHLQAKHPESLPDRVCPHCKDLTTKDVEILKLHVITEHREKCHECKKCKIAFHLLQELLRHNRKVHNETHYICEFCHSTFLQIVAFQKHQADIHNIKHYCDMCDFSTRTDNLLRDHKRAYHGGEGKRFQCSQCDKKFRKKGELLSHIRFTHDNVRINCELCDFKATNKTHVREHILRVHAGVTIFCPVCNGEFGSQSTLYDHMKNVHAEREKNIECDQCDKKFYSNSQLRRHIARVHLKVKKYKCSKCDFQGFLKNEVDKHEITHTTEMKECDKCGKQYKYHHKCKNLL